MIRNILGFLLGATLVIIATILAIKFAMTFFLLVVLFVATVFCILTWALGRKILDSFFPPLDEDEE